MKTVSAKSVLRKAWAQLSLKLRKEAGCCQKCGRKEHLQVHHLLPKKLYPRLLLEENNLVVLCPKCHSFGAGSAHKDGLSFAMWLRFAFPKKWEFIKKYLNIANPVVRQ